MLSSLVSLAFLSQIVRISIPYMLTALGGVTSERSGVINIALEGKLLVGAFCAAVGALSSGSVFVGLLCGILGGGLLGLVYGYCTVYLRADQIVSGIALNIMAIGGTRFFLKWLYGSTANSPQTPGFDSPFWFNPLFWVVVILIPVSHLVMVRTRFGLRLRAAGESPEAATVVGINVFWLRLRAVILSGMLAGLGGAFLAMDSHAFVSEMSGGRGYIALAAVIMGRWRPVWAVLACLLFAIAEAIQFQLQTLESGIPSEFLQTLPYMVTLLVLAGVMGKSKAPAALGKNL